MFDGVRVRGVDGASVVATAEGVAVAVGFEVLGLSFDDPLAEPLPNLNGRGAGYNPKNRFERLELSLDPSEGDPGEMPGRRTTFYTDAARTVLTRNDSPDIGYDVSLNPYRGCEHGCVYHDIGVRRLLI